MMRHEGHSEGLTRLTGARIKLSQQVRELEDVSLRIMGQAAIDMGCSPADFNAVPWLGGGKRSRDKDGMQRGVKREPMLDKTAPIDPAQFTTLMLESELTWEATFYVFIRCIK